MNHTTLHVLIQSITVTCFVLAMVSATIIAIILFYKRNDNVDEEQQEENHNLIYSRNLAV